MKWYKVNLVPVILFIILGMMQYRLWFQSGGMIDMFRLKKRLVVEQTEN